MKRGDLLVPIETPYGPPQARVAWADELGQLLVVTSVSADGLWLGVNAPACGETVRRAAADVLAEFEAPDPDDPFGRRWAATITRAATEAARVDDTAGYVAGTARYWERVVAVVGRVLREETA